MFPAVQELKRNGQNRRTDMTFSVCVIVWQSSEVSSVRRPTPQQYPLHTLMQNRLGFEEFTTHIKQNCLIWFKSPFQPRRLHNEEQTADWESQAGECDRLVIKQCCLHYRGQCMK